MPQGNSNLWSLCLGGPRPTHLKLHSHSNQQSVLLHKKTGLNYSELNIHFVINTQELFLGKKCKFLTERVLELHFQIVEYYNLPSFLNFNPVTIRRTSVCIFLTDQSLHKHKLHTCESLSFGVSEAPSSWRTPMSWKYITDIRTCSLNKSSDEYHNIISGKKCVIQTQSPVDLSKPYWLSCPLHVINID
jgi:hypothetical protein